MAGSPGSVRRGPGDARRPEFPAVAPSAVAFGLAICGALAHIGGVRSPVPMQFLRLLLGLLAMFFAYELGRVATRLHHGGQPMTRALTWLLRTVVSLGAILWTRGFDWLADVTLTLAAASLAAGIYLESRPQRTEEIHLFTKE
jgi:hypothetical protein